MQTARTGRIAWLAVFLIAAGALPSPASGVPTDPNDDGVDDEADGLSNKAETFLGSSLALGDTDSDGIPDAFDLMPKEEQPMTALINGRLVPAFLLTFRLSFLEELGGCEPGGKWDPYEVGISANIRTGLGDVGGGFLVPPGLREDTHKDGRGAAELGDDSPTLSLMLPQDFGLLSSPGSAALPGVSFRAMFMEHDVIDDNPINLAGTEPAVEFLVDLASAVVERPFWSYGMDDCHGRMRLDVVTPVTYPSLFASWLSMNPPPQVNFITYSMIKDKLAGGTACPACAEFVELPPCLLGVCPMQGDAADTTPVTSLRDSTLGWASTEPGASTHSDEDDLADGPHALQSLSGIPIPWVEGGTERAATRPISAIVDAVRRLPGNNAELSDVDVTLTFLGTDGHSLATRTTHGVDLSRVLSNASFTFLDPVDVPTDQRIERVELRIDPKGDHMAAHSGFARAWSVGRVLEPSLQDEQILFRLDRSESAVEAGLFTGWHEDPDSGVSGSVGLALHDRVKAGLVPRVGR